MKNTKKAQTVEDIQRMIVNHPVKAYMEIGVDFSEAIDINGQRMLRLIITTFSGLMLTLKSLLMLGRCIFGAICHMILLAFYPFVKLYYIVGARREIIRSHPEYKQPRRKGQIR